MSAASKKALVAASVAALALLALASGASGGWGAQFAERFRDRQPPTAPGNLRVTAASAKSLSLAWDRSTDNVGVRGYYVYVNGRRSTVSSTAYTAGRLNCGQSVAVAVVAFDRAGNRSPRAETITSTAACPDTRPPTPPTGISQAATAGDAVVLVWNPASDDVGVVGYGVYSGGLLVASSPEPAVTLSGLTCASTYAYEIDAVDAAGNRSSRTPYWAVTADCADVEPPSKPTDLTLVDSTRSSLSLEWSPSSDNVGVAGYRLAVTGPPGASSVSTRTVDQPSATVTGLACGTTYDVDVEAYDSAGNSSLPATVSASTDDCSARRLDPAHNANRAQGRRVDPDDRLPRLGSVDGQRRRPGLRRVRERDERSRPSASSAQPSRGSVRHVLRVRGRRCTTLSATTPEW